MVAPAAEAFATSPSITAKELDSARRPILAIATHTHIIANFSIFVFSEPVVSLRYVFRTLKDGGLAASLTRKRVWLGATIRKAQRAVRPGTRRPASKVAIVLQESLAAKAMEDTVFVRAKMTILVKGFVRGGMPWPG
ncbi:hypothetical protein J3458_003426 [Metarhizium acridum]|uniref:uncharacterized protein n=1 Tax=Metarhizium acridum TaxID=92637 RepID=UPI001C6D050A|nr:hypothetical protein J3458_003426 [Metarhizium acridum]